MVGAETRGLNGRSSHDGEVTKAAACAATNLGAGGERIVLVRHEQQKLGKDISVRPGETSTVAEIRFKRD